MTDCPQKKAIIHLPKEITFRGQKREDEVTAGSGTGVII
jgi:hypothetical protein